MVHNIINLINFAIKFFWLACILTGVHFIVASIVNYQVHRDNTKLVPLVNIIIELFLGLLAISIPFLDKLFGTDAYDIIYKH